MTSIVICEKPSQARNLRAAIGSRYGRILAARGHLLRLSEPEEVNPNWKTWSYDVLRPESGFYPLKVDRRDGKGALLDEIESALKEAGRVIIATDCDREGQAIGENLLRFFKFKGDVLRAMFNAEDPASLQAAFEDLKSNATYRPLYQAAVARAQGDQIANLTATRVVTLSLKPAGMRGALGIGRVKTPTMGIVCRREREIAAFKRRNFYEPWVDVTGDGSELRLIHRPGGEDRIFDAAALNDLIDTASHWAGPVAVKQERKSQKPPRLMDLPALQSRAGRWGWPASKTLEVAQSLYADHKLITYPRAENRYLPEVEIGNAGAMLSGLKTLPFCQVGFDEPVIRKGKSGSFSDKALEGSSHHAVVPNVRTVDQWTQTLGALSDGELKLFKLIAKSYLAAIAPDRVYDRTEVSAEIGGRAFSRAGVVDREPGWRAVFTTDPDAPDADTEKDANDTDESPLPAWEDGQKVSAKDAGIDEKVTKPPSRYTEGSLIKAMQDAWRFSDDPAVIARLKESAGIGTPATRGNILDGLKRQNLIDVKSGKLHASDLAMALHDVLETEAPEFLDPAATAEMELALDGLLKGEGDPRQVVDALVARAADLAGRMGRRGAGRPIEVDIKVKPSPKMLAAAKAKAKREGVSLPRGATTDRSICEAFLGTRPEGNAPSKAQIGFARKIAESAGINLPEDIASDRKALSDWIDANHSALPKVAAKPPSEKQVQLASKLAERDNVEIPDAAIKSARELFRWIDQRMGKTGKGKKRKAGTQH